MLGLCLCVTLLIRYCLRRIQSDWIASLLVASMLGFTCQAVRGFPTLAPCLEHVCAGGGGVV